MNRAAPLSLQQASSITEVLANMAAVESALDKADGVACFNQMYQEVTQQVDAAPTGTFDDLPLLLRLDVIFANLYFAALSADSPGSPPGAWAPLLARRAAGGVSPLQFALAGMNAHINRDLPVALLQTCQERGSGPVKGSAMHRDYLRINDLLRAKETAMKGRYLQGTLRELDPMLFGMDDVLSMWSIVKAREVAWDHAEILWLLRGSPQAVASYVANLDCLVGLTGRGLLCSVPAPAGGVEY